MTKKSPAAKPPANQALRRPAPNMIDQRQQQIDPAGHHRVDDNARPDSDRKQPEKAGPEDGGRS